MAGDIKQKIVLEGEKEYREALRSAQRNLKTLKSELKAETAELGKNATAQQKAETSAKNLQKQIKEQEKIVQTYKEALEEVRQKYGDNEDAIAKYEQKLNEARATLANMKGSLNDVSGGFQAISDGAASSTLETKALADSFGTIADKADVMASALEGVFTSVTGVIADAVAAVWGELMKVAGKADEYFDLGAYLGASATEVQKWSKAMEYAGGDISTITNLISRLKYGGKADKVTEWFGVSDVNYTNDLKYFQDVLQQMYEMKKTMTDAQWTQAMTDIFGARKTQELDGVLSDWETILKGLQENDVENGGMFGLTEEELSDMAALNEQVMKLKSNWESLKEMATVRLFGSLAMDLTSNAQGILDALVELMGIDPKDPDAANKRDAAIKKLEQNLTEAFTRIGEAIGNAAKALDEAGGMLQGSENSYVRLIGDLMVGLSDVLEWMGRPDSLEIITHFLEGFFALWAGSKAVGAVATISQLIANIGLISGAGAVSGAAAKAAGTSIGTSWGSAFGAAVLKAAPWLSGLGILFGNAFTPQGNDDILTKEEEALLAQGKMTPEMKAKMIGARANELGTAVIDQNGNTVYVTDEELNRRPNHNTRQRNIEGVAEPIISEPVGGFFSDLINKLNQNTLKESLPLWLFNGRQPWLTSQDINTFTGLPSQITKAVASGVSSIKVNLDGRAVGNLVAPYVSQYIVRDVPMN